METKKEVILDGASLSTIRDVHVNLALALDFGPYYGHNLDALWDMLTTEIERPLLIEWKNSALSAAKFNSDFEQIVQLFHKVIEFDKQSGFQNQFDFKLF